MARMRFLSWLRSSVQKMRIPEVERRKLKLKAKHENGSSYFGFKRRNHARSTRGQPRVNLHRPTVGLCTRSTAVSTLLTFCPPARD